MPGLWSTLVRSERFAYQEDAQAYFISLGGPASDPDRLDGDHDGQACDSLPHRTSACRSSSHAAYVHPRRSGRTVPT